MSIENEIAGLTQSTTDLLEAVNTKKATLDTAVSNAQTAVTDATSQVSLAAAEKVGAQTARDTAESFKDQAYTYSQSAASAVAYQDLTAIAQTKAESAVDVFVYDTSKDSDGGAWRKRTQHTSWYNETLNTATRGSRKDFPAVAVIVTDTLNSKVVIYDADDPSMPMWMVFSMNLAGWHIGGYDGTAEVTSLYMLNGTLVAGGTHPTNPASRSLLSVIHFISDKNTGYRHQTHVGLLYFGDVATRNSTSLSSDIIINDGSRPANSETNDVAMTVLPNAPIDPDTGLPIPTIAVANNGGVSVIKDDGNIVDITITQTYKGANKIAFTEDNKIAFSAQQSGGSTAYWRYIVGEIPSSDVSYAYWNN